MSSPTTSQLTARSTATVPFRPSRRPVIGVVPLRSIDDRARAALGTAWSMTSASRLVAVHVSEGSASDRDFTRRWEQWEPGIPLVLLQRVPFDGDPVAVSIADYLRRRHTAQQTLVVIAEEGHPGGSGHADALEAALLPLPHVVVCRQRLVHDGERELRH